MKYEIRTNKIFGDSIIGIDSDGKEYGIPEDEANSDYQAYLAWLAEQPKAK